MRALWLTENYFPDQGGMAQSCDRIVSGLRQHGIEVDVAHLSARKKFGGNRLSHQTKQYGLDIFCPIGADLSHGLQRLWNVLEDLHGEKKYTHVASFGGYLPMIAGPVFAAWVGAPLTTMIRGNDFDTAVFHPKRKQVLRDAIEASTTVLSRSPAAFADWLNGKLRAFAPTLVIIDAFPAGIIGEWSHITGLRSYETWHVARLLRWSEYSRRLGSNDGPWFDRVFLLEDIDPQHRLYLAKHCPRLEDLQLKDPPHEPDLKTVTKIQDLAAGGRPVWAVIHSGGRDEIQQLIDYTFELAHGKQLDPVIAVFCPDDRETVSILERDGRQLNVFHDYPVHALFPFFDMVISACGLNAARQIRNAAVHHRFLPFERALDDQFLRASRLRSRYMQRD